jgi:hypothetical protein
MDSLSQKRHFSQMDADAGHDAFEDDSDHKLAQDSTNTSKAEAALRAKPFRKRTKSGCLTCRKRRIKCSEERPVCKNCIKSKRHCEGYSQRVVFRPPHFEYRAALNGGAHITFQTGTIATPMIQMQPGQMPYMLDPNVYQMRLKCCHKNCSGTDKYICDVIKSLSNHKKLSDHGNHKIHICKECFVRLPDDSADNVHRSPDCVKHCLSTTCDGNPTPAISQRHPFIAGTCSSRSKPRDIEDNYRYIFRLVYPDPETHPPPDNVFTTEKKNHEGVKPRHRTHVPNNQELLARSYALTAQANASAAQVEELRRVVAANSTQIEILTRELVAERTTTTHLRKQMQRWQVIADEALQPDTVGNPKLLCNLRRRAAMETSDAMDFASASSQALQTPPVSLHASQRSSALSTPSDTGTTRQDQPSRNISQRHHNNRAAGEIYYTSDQGNRALNSYPGENALLHTQNNPSAFSGNSSSAHDITASFEPATDSGASTEYGVPRSDPDQHNLRPFNANQLQFNENHANPQQSSPSHSNWNQYDLNPLNPNLLNPHQLQPHQLYPHQFNSNQHNAFQSDAYSSHSDQLHPNHLNTNPRAGGTHDGSFGSTVGPQDSLPSTSFENNWLETQRALENDGSSIFQSIMEHGSMQRHHPPPGRF